MSGILRASFIPTPAEVEVRAAAIRSGEVTVNEPSFRKWAARRDEQHRMTMDEDDQRDAFTLAGELPEDACVMPSWLDCERGFKQFTDNAKPNGPNV